MSIQDRKQREFQRRGQEILAAALSLFASDDWEAVTVEEIAQKADVGKGTVYKHFASKDEIYARLAMDFQSRILDGFAAIDSKGPVIERLRSHMRVAWEVHLSSKQLHRVFLYCSRGEFRARLAPDLLAELQVMEARVAEPTHRLVAEAIAVGVFPNKPLSTLLFGAQAAFWGGVQLIWSGYLGEIDLAKHLDSLGDFILSGLAHIDRPLAMEANATDAHHG